MDLSLLSTNTVLLFLMILVRITGMLVVAPFFSQTAVPVQVQVGIAATLSIILFPLYSGQAHVPATDLWQFAWGTGQEFAIGLLIGFAATLVFAAVQLAGSHVTTQMGLSIAQAVDPGTHQQAPIMGQLYFILAMLLFLSLNIHHGLILAVAKSFEAIPLASGFTDMGLLAGRFTEMAGDLFILSIMLVLPVLGIMLIQEIALALVSKIMPQMNVFMVSLPLKVGVALLLIMVTLPFTAHALTNAFSDLMKHLLALYQS